MARLKAIALIGAAMLAGACTAMLPRLEAPHLSVVAIELGSGGNMQQQQVRLTLHASNPNDRAIAIRSIECKLEIDNMAFAQGETLSAFTLPAKGAVDFDANVVANLNSALVALAGSLGHSNVNYRLYGEVHLKGSMLHSIPFDQKGRIRL